RLLLEQVSAVGQQQAAQGDAAASAMDASAKSLLDQGGQVARMVQVGVGQDHRVDRRRFDRKRSPVTVAQLLVALEQAAVDEQAMAVGLDQVARAGDGARGTEELEGGTGFVVHGCSCGWAAM